MQAFISLQRPSNGRSQKKQYFQWKMHSMCMDPIYMLRSGCIAGSDSQTSDASYDDGNMYQ